MVQKIASAITFGMIALNAASGLALPMSSEAPDATTARVERDVGMASEIRNIDTRDLVSTWGSNNLDSRGFWSKITGLFTKPTSEKPKDTPSPSSTNPGQQSTPSSPPPKKTPSSTSTPANPQVSSHSNATTSTSHAKQPLETNSESNNMDQEPEDEWGQTKDDVEGQGTMNEGGEGGEGTEDGERANGSSGPTG